MMDLPTLWIIAGLVLIIGEMLTGGFFLLFISLGCFAAALAAMFAFPLFGQGMLCAAVSVIGVVLLRKPIQKRLLKTISLKADIGNQIRIDHPIPPHHRTRIQYQGTFWEATNLDSETLKQGDQVVIVGIDGNTLLVRKAH